MCGVIGEPAGQPGRSSVIVRPAGACHHVRQFPLPEWSREYSTPNVHEYYNFLLLFLEDLQNRICCHGLDLRHHFPQLGSSFLGQEIESPPVLRRDVIDEAGLPKNETWLEGSGLGGESVNTELGPEAADTDELWHRVGGEQVVTEALAHLIVGHGPAADGPKIVTCLELDEEDWHLFFADREMDGEFWSFLDTLVLGHYSSEK